MRTQKLFNQLAATSAALLLGASSLSAQSVLWGAGHTNPHIDSVGRFASADGTLTSLGWTTTSVYCTNLNGQPNTPTAWTRDSTCANAVWTYSANGRGQGWSSGLAANAIQSPSLADGAAIFDADYLDNAGQTSGSLPVFNAGVAPNGYYSGSNRIGVESYIESPFFDMTGSIGTPMLLEFNSRLRWLGGYQTSFFRVEVSADSGRTWQTAGVHAGLASGVLPAADNVERVDLTSMFSSFVGGANYNPAYCKIRFRFAGGYYFWIIDDVRIKEKPNYDLRIAPLGAGNTLGDDFTVLRVSNSRFQPLSQVSADEYAFGAKVVMSELGSMGLPAAANARLVVEIEDAASVVFTDSIALGAMPLGFDTTVTKEILGWLPSAEGDYFVTYYVKHDSVEGIPANDSSFTTFTITNNYYSKTRRNTTDFGPNASRTIFPAAGTGNVVTEFEYGSMFYFPEGDSAVLDSVQFRVFVPSSLQAGVTSAPVTIRVYKFVDINNDQLDAAGTNNPDITLVGIGFDTIPMTTTNAYQLGSARILDFGGATGTEPLVLKDTTVYLVTMDVRSSVGLANTSNAFRSVIFGADALNYGINASAFTASPSPVRVADAPSGGGTGGTNDWNWVGFGAEIVPSIGLILADVVIAITEVEQVTTNFALYPNPAKHELNVNVGLDKASNVTYIMTDLSGRVVRMVTHKNVQSEVVTFGVEDLASGVYFVTVKTDKGIQTQRFVKE